MLGRSGLAEEVVRAGGNVRDEAGVARRDGIVVAHGLHRTTLDAEAPAQTAPPGLQILVPVAGARAGVDAGARAGRLDPPGAGRVLPHAREGILDHEARARLPGEHKL